MSDPSSTRRAMSDLGSTACCIGGFAGQTIGKSAPQSSLAIVLSSCCVRAVCFAARKKFGLVGTIALEETPNDAVL